MPQYPDVPTLAESGLPGFEAGSWYGLVGAQGHAARDRRQAQRRDAEHLRRSGVPRPFLAPSFIFSIASPPEQFAERIRADLGEMGQGDQGRQHQGGVGRVRPLVGGFTCSSRQRGEIDRLPRLLLALHFEERERAQRLRPALRAQRAERFADFAVLEASDAPRPACRADDRTARPRTRIPPRPRRPRPRCSGAPKCVDELLRQRVDRGEAVVLARLDDLHQRRPAERGTPRKPARNAARALPSSVAGSSSENTNAPDTAHSPGSAARSNTNVSDGSSRMVRSSFIVSATWAPASRDRATTARRARQQRPPLDVGLAHAPHQQVAVVVDVAAHALLRREPREIVLRDRAEAVLLPGVDRTMRWRAKLSTSRPEPTSSKPSSSSAADSGRRPGSPSAIDDGADHGAEHQPLRRLVLRPIGPGELRRRRPGRRRRGSRPARRRRSASPAARARPARRRARPCRHRTRAARCAAARPAPAPPRIRRDRSGRRKPACRRPARRRSPWHGRRRRRPRAASPGGTPAAGRAPAQTACSGGFRAACGSRIGTFELGIIIT